MPIVTTDLSLFEFILIFSLGAGYLNGFDGSFLFPTIGVGMLTFSFSFPPVLKGFCCMLQGVNNGGVEGNNWGQG